MADALRFVASSGLSRYEGAAISCGIKAAIGCWATDGANSPLAFKVRAELAPLDVSPELPVDSTKILAFSTEDGSPSRFTCIASTKGPASPTALNWRPSHLRPNRLLRKNL
jgi:hypothetical protein